MPQIPTDIKTNKLIALLKKHGFVEIGTLRAILRQSGITVQDLEDAR